MDKPLIFLDIDGVLNGHAFDAAAMSCSFEPQCVMLFNRLLADADAEVVISSSWRYMITGGAMTLRGFEYLLRTHHLAVSGRLVGHTVRDEAVPTRGGQISEWLSRDPRDRYVVLDDLDLGITAAGHPLVLTDGSVGLTEADYAAALAVLVPMLP